MRWSGWLMGLWMWCTFGLSLQAATEIAEDTTACAVAPINSYLSDTVTLTPPENFPSRHCVRPISLCGAEEQPAL